MRALGLHRGNATVRVAVHQALRRRLYAGLTPHAGDPARGPHDPCFTREFFEQARADALPRMARVAELDDGELRYFGGRDLSLWALVHEHALVFAEDFRDTPEQIRERAGRWFACLRTRTAPGPASRHWGHPVYGARLDPRSDDLDVVWAVPGAWVGFVQAAQAWTRAGDLPAHWRAAGAAAG